MFNENMPQKLRSMRARRRYPPCGDLAMWPDQEAVDKLVGKTEEL